MSIGAANLILTAYLQGATTSKDERSELQKLRDAGEKVLLRKGVFKKSILDSESGYVVFVLEGPEEGYAFRCRPGDSSFFATKGMEDIIEKSLLFVKRAQEMDKKQGLASKKGKIRIAQWTNGIWEIRVADEFIDSETGETKLVNEKAFAEYLKEQGYTDEQIYEIEEERVQWFTQQGFRYESDFLKEFNSRNQAEESDKEYGVGNNGAGWYDPSGVSSFIWDLMIKDALEKLARLSRRCREIVEKKMQELEEEKKIEEKRMREKKLQKLIDRAKMLTKKAHNLILRLKGLLSAGKIAPQTGLKLLGKVVARIQALVQLMGRLENSLGISEADVAEVSDISEEEQNISLGVIDNLKEEMAGEDSKLNRLARDIENSEEEFTSLSYALA